MRVILVIATISLCFRENDAGGFTLNGGLGDLLGLGSSKSSEGSGNSGGTSNSGNSGGALNLGNSGNSGGASNSGNSIAGGTGGGQGKVVISLYCTDGEPLAFQSIIHSQCGPLSSLKYKAQEYVKCLTDGQFDFIDRIQYCADSSKSITDGLSFFKYACSADSSFLSNFCCAVTRRTAGVSQYASSSARLAIYQRCFDYTFPNPPICDLNRVFDLQGSIHDYCGVIQTSETVAQSFQNCLNSKGLFTQDSLAFCEQMYNSVFTTATSRWQAYCSNPKAMAEQYCCITENDALKNAASKTDLGRKQAYESCVASTIVCQTTDASKFQAFLKPYMSELDRPTAKSILSCLDSNGVLKQSSWTTCTARTELFFLLYEEFFTFASTDSTSRFPDLYCCTVQAADPSMSSWDTRLPIYQKCFDDVFKCKAKEATAFANDIQAKCPQLSTLEYKAHIFAQCTNDKGLFTEGNKVACENDFKKIYATNASLYDAVCRNRHVDIYCCAASRDQAKDQSLGDLQTIGNIVNNCLQSTFPDPPFCDADQAAKFQSSHDYCQVKLTNPADLAKLKNCYYNKNHLGVYFAECAALYQPDFVYDRDFAQFVCNNKPILKDVYCCSVELEYYHGFDNRDFQKRLALYTSCNVDFA